ncbi:hypothetical protein ACX29Z_000455 [Escherichia coli]|nr:hypothetical protein [Escherichia coli]
MKINIITVDGYFGQRLPTSKSLELQSLEQHLNLYGVKCEFIDIQDVQNLRLDSDTRCIIGSHQNLGVKKYIDDVISIKFENYRDSLIPSVRNILAHENKGVQAIIMKECPDLFVQQNYYYRDDIEINKVKVLKRTYGAGSFGVALATDNKTFLKQKKKMFYSDLKFDDIKFYIFECLKKYIFPSKLSKEHTIYFQRYNPYVLQDFIPDLNSDYKVLVFGNKYYVLKRNVRDNDFRASGSGKFVFEDVSEKFLSFARKVIEFLHTPYASLDIVERGDGFGCIEFQCVHFGPYTQLNAEYYYEFKNGKWIREKNNYTLEQVYAEALVDFLKNE